jgi:hypothetical protein
MTTIIKHYTTLALEGRHILELWDEMKQEIQLQAQRHEDHKRRHKNTQYIELEQQIDYLTEKNELTEAEERVLNIVGTTLQNKFQQEAKRRILHDHNLNQQQKHTRLPISPPKLLTPNNHSSKLLTYMVPL